VTYNPWGFNVDVGGNSDGRAYFGGGIGGGSSGVSGGGGGGDVEGDIDDGS